MSIRTKLLGVAVALALFSIPAKADLVTITYAYAVSGVFYPVAENCPDCSSLDLSGTVTVSQLTNTLNPFVSETTITAVNLVVGGLSAFTTIDPQTDRQPFNNYFIYVHADGLFSSMTIQVHTWLTSDVLQTAIYSGAIVGDFPQQFVYYRMTDGSFDKITSVPGPIAGAGLPGLVIAVGGMLAWWRREVRRAAATATGSQT